MHVVYCIQSLHSPTGIERIVTAKANYLVSEYGYKVSMITTDMGNRAPAFELNREIKTYDLGINYFENTTRNPLKKLLSKRQKIKAHRKRLSELLFKLNADVVVSTFTEEMTFLPKIKDGSRKVLELHSCKRLKQLFEEIKSNKYPPHVYLSVLIDLLLYKYKYIPSFDKFVCLTKEDLVYWGGASAKRCFIHNMQPWMTEKKADLDNKTVIAVGSLIKRKGFARLIEIWKEIVVKYPDWKLIIIGDGPERQSLQQKINESGLTDCVILNGQRKDMQAEYRGASVMAMTSVCEGLPMCLIEAKAYGIPTVSYDFPCGPKDTINHETDGYIVKNGDKQSFCYYLEKLMSDSDLRKKMGLAQTTDAERFSQKFIMSQWKELFENRPK